LHVSGPRKVQRQLEEYVANLERLIADGKAVVFEDTIKPLDIESLPLKDQAMYGVLGDAIDKAEESGVENPLITVSRDQWMARLKELKKLRRTCEETDVVVHTRPVVFCDSTAAAGLVIAKLNVSDLVFCKSK
jgi:hypothetical protein